MGSRSTAEEKELRGQLTELPGVEAVLWSGGDMGVGGSGPGMAELGTTRAWLRILAATATRMSEELDCGAPHVLTVSYDARLIALAVDPGGAIMAVLASEPSVMGLAVVKLRGWLTIRRQR